MDSLFLRELPVVSLTDGDGDSQDFIADFPEPRPSLEHTKIWSEKWRAHIVEKATEAMKRKNCAVSYIQFVVDQHGFLVIVCFNHTLLLGDAKRAAKVLFKGLPDGATCRAARKGLRPLDEVDADRIRAWQTAASLRPKGKKRTREESDDETAVIRFVKPRQEQKKAEPAKKTAAELLAELSDASSSEEEEVPQPRLMLTNGPTGATVPTEANGPTDATDYYDADFHGPHQRVGTPGEERGSARHGAGWRCPYRAPISPLPP